jgi:hypothetical protein
LQDRAGWRVGPFESRPRSAHHVGEGNRICLARLGGRERETHPAFVRQTPPGRATLGAVGSYCARAVRETNPRLVRRMRRGRSVRIRQPTQRPLAEVSRGNYGKWAEGANPWCCDLCAVPVPTSRSFRTQEVGRGARSRLVLRRPQLELSASPFFSHQIFATPGFLLAWRIVYYRGIMRNVGNVACDGPPTDGHRRPRERRPTAPHPPGCSVFGEGSAWPQKTASLSPSR